MSSVCTYTSYTPSTCHQALANIKSFLELKGWHTEEYVTGASWQNLGGSVYGWDYVTGDSESFLEIISGGYDYVYGVNPGKQQTMRYRFRVTASGDDPAAEYLYVSLIDPNNPTYSTALSTHPYTQNDIGSFSMGIPTGSGLTLHCFNLTTGSPTFDIFVLQLTDYICNMFAMGVPDLFVQTDTLWALFGQAHVLAYYNITSLNMNTKSPAVKWNDYRQGDSGIWTPNHWCGGISGWNVAQDGFICPYGGAVLKNDYCGKRAFIKPIYFCTEDNDVLWPVGSYPWYFCKWSGLDMAETITYGSQQYIVFPDGLTSKEFGIGLRIA